MFYDTIKKYYQLGLYNDANLDLFVSIKWITSEQKEEIVASKQTA